MNRAFPPRDDEERSWSALPIPSQRKAPPSEDTAESYLLSVRQEACTIPDVLYAHASHPAPAASRPRATPPARAPPSGWAASVLEAFAELHAYVASCESFRDAGGALPLAPKLPHWRTFVFGEVSAARGRVADAKRRRRSRAADVEDWPSSDDEAQQESESDDGAGGVEEEAAAPAAAAGSDAPWLSAVLALDQRGVRDVLSRAVDAGEARGALELRAALWLYGLLSRLGRPLLATDAAAVRRLFLLCSAQRERAVVAGSGAPAEPGLAAALDALVIVAGSFFGQRLSHE